LIRIRQYLCFVVCVKPCCINSICDLVWKTYKKNIFCYCGMTYSGNC
jgi:hypothetical protein